MVSQCVDVYIGKDLLPLYRLAFPNSYPSSFFLNSYPSSFFLNSYPSSFFLLPKLLSFFLLPSSFFLNSYNMPPPNMYDDKQ
jgi:hypothetical protein